MDKLLEIQRLIKELRAELVSKNPRLRVIVILDDMNSDVELIKRDLE